MDVVTCVTSGDSPPASAGTAGRSKAPVATTTLTARHDPPLAVVTTYPPSTASTAVTASPSWTGAPKLAAYAARRSASSVAVR